MERTANRSGFKLRSGNSTPFKEIGARPIAPPKPGSSKEELMEIAEGFDVDVENIDLDYGGGFDMSIDMSGVSGGKLDDPPPGGDEPVTRTPAQIEGIEQDEITVKGANKQSHYQSGGGFGGNNTPEAPK